MKTKPFRIVITTVVATFALASCKPPQSGIVILPEKNKEEEKIEAKNPKPVVKTAPEIEPEKRKFSYKEKREFETLEKEIAELTKEKELVDLRLNADDTPFEELQKLSNRIGEVAKLLDEKELRWLELSELAK